MGLPDFAPVPVGQHHGGGDSTSPIRVDVSCIPPPTYSQASDTPRKATESITSNIDGSTISKSHKRRRDARRTPECIWAHVHPYLDGSLSSYSSEVSHANGITLAFEILKNVSGTHLMRWEFLGTPHAAGSLPEETGNPPRATA